MIYSAVMQILIIVLSLSLLDCVTLSHAQTIEDLKKGVVKVIAKTEGKTKVGTGFIVRLEKDVAYVVTAAHVIEGDPQPKVVFRGKETKSFPAEVKGMNGGDSRGVAALVVSGDVAQGVGVLPVSSDFESNGGEAVTVIGFPRMPAVPWAVTPGTVTGQDGAYLVFSSAASEGNSGGPVLWNGKVIGVITEVLSPYGYAVPIGILRLALRGWGVPLEAESKEVKRSPDEKGAKDQLPQEITGKGRLQSPPTLRSPELTQKKSVQPLEVQSVEKLPLAIAKQGDKSLAPGSRENVSSQGCYIYGDNETLTQAKQVAQNIAQEKAVRSHGVFVQSSTKVKNFQLEDSVVQTASAGILEQIRVEKVEKKAGQEICVTISAKLSPLSLEELIQQQINAKEIANEAAKSKVQSSTLGFAVRVWTNKTDGRFFEGEQLIIYVRPERDGYLKLDYFQADGKVVHLIPNHSRGQAMIKAGQTYVFGGADSSEKFVIQPPYGNEVVKAMLSAQPFEFPDAYKPVEDSRQYLKNLDSGFRGVRLSTFEGSVASASFVTSGKTVNADQDTHK